MSNVSKRRREGSRTKIKSVGDHNEFLNRITKTLYYGQLPTLPCLSLPVTEVSCEVWSVGGRGRGGRSLRRLHADAAAGIARGACVSPCALVLALLYLERLNACNPHYLDHAHPQDLFLVSLMVGNKFLQDDGEDDEVICSEWAESGGIDLKQLKNLEKEFLHAIDWNVFVSEASFEAGLAWLERRVARRQARARGFFTYTDLAAAGGEGGAGELLRAVAAACAAAALAYIAALLALLAAAHLAARAAPLTPLAPRTTNTAALHTNNATLHAPLHLVADDSAAADRLGNCAQWARLADRPEPGLCERAAPPWRWAGRADVWAERVDKWAGRVDEWAAARAWLDVATLRALLTAVSDR